MQLWPVDQSGYVHWPGSAAWLHTPAVEYYFGVGVQLWIASELRVQCTVGPPIFPGDDVIN